MKKINILIIFAIILFLSKNSFAETKQDCSQYSSKTLVGQYDKWRCKKGKPEREKLSIGKKLKDLNPFKKKN